MRFRLAVEAREEADEAAAWYESRRPGLGDEFLDSLRQCTTRIRANPRGFSKLEYPEDIKQDVRRVVLRRFPYVVVYLIGSDEVVVLAVAHARREPGYWMVRLEEDLDS